MKVQRWLSRWGAVPILATASCHTALIDGYVIEGYESVEDIRLPLAERPDARGLAAPGMLMGSPGMEMGAKMGSGLPFQASTPASARPHGIAS